MVGVPVISQSKQPGKLLVRRRVALFQRCPCRLLKPLGQPVCIAVGITGSADSVHHRPEDGRGGIRHAGKLTRRIRMMIAPLLRAGKVVERESLEHVNEPRRGVANEAQCPHGVDAGFPRVAHVFKKVDDGVLCCVRPLACQYANKPRRRGGVGRLLKAGGNDSDEGGAAVDDTN